MKKKILLFIAVVFSMHCTFAQHEVTGKVTDGDSGDPLVGVAIFIKGTTVGTTTDVNGTYSLSASDEATLVYSFIGYVNQEVTVGGRTTIDLSLAPDITQLGEVVVTALGLEEKKSSLSYSTTKIDSKGFNASRIGDISQQLSGQVAGLSITTGNGSGVSSSRIVLRGEASLNINANQPLIIVDGVVVSNNLDGIAGTTANGWTNNPVDYGNGLTDFNTDDIEDVTILKGPKAAALYGARATNGAIVIRTKSGLNKEGLGIELNTGVSVEKVGNFWDEQNEYGGGFSNEFRLDWGGNYGAPVDGTLIEQPTADQSYSGITVPATPYLKRLDRKGFFETGVSYNNSLGISFGNENTWGRLSLGKLNKTGIIPNTEYDRSNISLRLGSNLNEKLSIDFSGHYVNSGSESLPTIGAGTEGVINNMFWGMNNYDYNDYRNYWVDDIPYGEQNYFISWGTNPYLIAYENLNGFNRRRVYGNIKATYQINDNLSFFVRAGTDFYTDKRRSQRASGQPNFSSGMFREQIIGYSESNIDFLFTYNNNLSDNIGLKVMAGGNRMDQNFSNDLFQTNDLIIAGIYSKANAEDTPNIVQTDRSKRINSLYGTTQFSYGQSIYLDITARGDWSSSLPADNNFFFYPSVGLSVVVSELVDMPDIFSFAQVRASLAKTGNDVGAGAVQPILDFGTLSGAINPTVKINPNLQPERTTAKELGFEIKMLSNRIGLDFNIYNNSTINQILFIPISESTGASSFLTNAGEIRNKGVELFLKGTPVKTQSFEWNSSLAWTRNRGTVVELGDDLESFTIAQGSSGGSVQARPGGRMGDIYGRGYERSPEGDIILEVIDDGTRDVVRPIKTNEVKLLGNYNPDWTAGFTNSFKYKNFDLKVLFDYRYGGVLVSNTTALLYRSGIITESLPYRTEDFVPTGVIDNGDGTYSENTTATTGQDWYRSNFDQTNLEANTFDATFLKLREIAIGVDLTKWMKKLPFSSAHLSVFGRNLWIKTKDDGLRHFDPEALTMAGGSLIPGFEVGQLPSPQVFGANLKIKL